LEAAEGILEEGELDRIKETIMAVDGGACRGIKEVEGMMER